MNNEIDSINKLADDIMKSFNIYKNNPMDLDLLGAHIANLSQGVDGLLRLKAEELMKEQPTNKQELEDWLPEDESFEELREESEPMSQDEMDEIEKLVEGVEIDNNKIKEKKNEVESKTDS